LLSFLFFFVFVFGSFFLFRTFFMDATVALRKKTTESIKLASSYSLQQQGLIVQQEVIHSIHYKNSKHVGIYLHMPGEVPTDLIIKDIFESGRYCYVPVVSGKDLIFYRINDINDYNSLKPNRWNIREPYNLELRENPVEKGILDLVIVPGLVFDKNSNRIGKGKGYYDRFLANLKSSFSSRNILFPYLMGLAFREQVVEKVPSQPHDFPMDTVIYTQYEE